MSTIFMVLESTLSRGRRPLESASGRPPPFIVV